MSGDELPLARRGSSWLLFISSPPPLSILSSLWALGADFRAAHTSPARSASPTSRCWITSPTYMAKRSAPRGSTDCRPRNIIASPGRLLDLSLLFPYDAVAFLSRSGQLRQAPSVRTCAGFLPRLSCTTPCYRAHDSLGATQGAAPMLSGLPCCPEIPDHRNALVSKARASRSSSPEAARGAGPELPGLLGSRCRDASILQLPPSTSGGTDGHLPALPWSALSRT